MEKVFPGSPLVTLRPELCLLKKRDIQIVGMADTRRALDPMANENPSHWVKSSSEIRLRIDEQEKLSKTWKKTDGNNEKTLRFPGFINFERLT